MISILVIHSNRRKLIFHCSNRAFVLTKLHRLYFDEKTSVSFFKVMLNWRDGATLSYKALSPVLSISGNLLLSLFMFDRSNPGQSVPFKG